MEPMDSRRQTVPVERSLVEDVGIAAGAVGLLGAIGGGLLYLFVEPLQSWAVRLLIIGFILLSASFVLAWRPYLSFLRARQGRYGLNTGVMIVALLAILVVLNIVSANNPARADLTATRQFTLASQTTIVLERLDTNVEALAFFTPRIPALGPLETQAENLLREYSVKSGKFDFRMVDFDQRPALAIQYGVDAPGTVVFATEDRTQLTTEMSERSFTTALLQVTGQELLNVCFLAGHGERNITDVEGSGYSEAALGLQRDNYLVSIFNSAIDDESELLNDCSILVVASPTQELASNELLLLGDFLFAGGKAVFLLDPNSPVTFLQLIAFWGVGNISGFVVDPDNRSDPLAPTVSKELMAGSVITDVLDVVILPEAAAFAPTVSQGDSGNIEAVLPFLFSSDRSWLETSVEGDIAFNPEVDIPGRVPMGYTTQSFPNPETGEATRIVVIGDSDFARNDFFSFRSNGDLFINSVNWLAEQEFLIAADRQVQSFRLLLLTDLQWRFILISSLGLLPLAVVAAGGVTWWLRR